MLIIENGPVETSLHYRTGMMSLEKAYPFSLNSSIRKSAAGSAFRGQGWAKDDIPNKITSASCIIALNVSGYGEIVVNRRTRQNIENLIILFPMSVCAINWGPASLTYVILTRCSCLMRIGFRILAVSLSMSMFFLSMAFSRLEKMVYLTNTTPTGFKFIKDFLWSRF